ncbi:MAG: hypothetical protein E7521_08650 [Ruminococcaceae bacterium]|nr:hypothetical protein [Oscillospiraceae bacterium]
MCKSRKNIFRLIIYIIVAVVAIAIDIFIFKNLSYTHIDTLVTTCFSALVSIAGIWVACYLLFLELFRDRYQMQFLKKNLYNSMKENFFFVIYCLFFGTIVMVLSIGVISAVVFSFLTIVTIAEILIKIFKANKSLMINSHIDKLQEELEGKIKTGKKLTFAELKDYRYLYDECIVKEEYYTIQNIVEKSGELFRTFLKNSIGTLDSSDLEKSFEAILEFNCMQLDFCKTIKSELLINKIAKQQYKNLKFCIDNFQSEWYKRYIDDLKFYFTSKKDLNSKTEITKDLFYYMHKIVLHLIESNKDDLAEHTIDTIQEHVSAFKFAYKDSEIDNFAMYNYLILNKCQDKNNDTWFIKISDKLNVFANSIYIKDIPFHTVKSYYALIFNYYYDKDKYKALDFCKNTVKTFNYDINSTEFTSFKYYCIGELYKLGENDTNFTEKVFTLHLEILQRSMSVKNKPDMILLPDLDMIILNNNPIKEKYEKYLEEFNSLLNTCIIENEATHFYKFLNCINEVLAKTKIQDKDIQIALLDTYLWAINRSKNLANKNFYKISFELLEQSIHKLDKERSISENLGKHIIHVLSDFAKSLSFDNNEIINASIDLLRNFSNDEKTLYFILKYPERKQQLYRSLFNIGTDCIENNYEEGTRRISNTLGWSIISCLKQPSAESANYLIDRAIDLYDISAKMKTSITTQVFIVTLFTTVGAFCCKDAKLYPFRNRIIEKLDAPMETIETAAKLRTCESDTWNELLENKTESLTNDFLKLYKGKHS